MTSSPLLSVGAVALAVLGLVVVRLRASQQQKCAFSGRELIDPILRNRHSIAKGTVPAWTAAQVAQHNTPEDLWIIVKDKVYDVTDYVQEHPGGERAICKQPGGDNTEMFYGPQHPAKVHDIIGEYFVGNLAKA